MGRIYYIFGKSASGKDSFYHRLMSDADLSLKKIIMYTTRPIRSGEKDGEEYFFIDEERLEQLKSKGRVIESRTYLTMHGPWIYATVNDGQIDLESGVDYAALGDFNSYISMRDYFGSDVIVPVYVEVEDGERLARALFRERSQKEPKYAELCRRFLSDREQFAEERLAAEGISRRYVNDDFERCYEEIKADILKGARG